MDGLLTGWDSGALVDRVLLMSLSMRTRSMGENVKRIHGDFVVRNIGLGYSEMLLCVLHGRGNTYIC